MELFILPSLKVYDIHIHFQLEDSDCKFTNHRSIDGARLHYRENTFSSLQVYFSKYTDDIFEIQEGYQTSTPRRSLSISFTSSEYGDPIIKYRYVNTLDKQGSVNETSRAVHHWRQWKSYQSCMQAFDTVQDFDLYGRLREDLLFHATFVPPLVWLNQIEYDVWLPQCASWHGLNDKLAFVHPRVCEHYFMGVLDTYEQQYDDLRCFSNQECRYIFQTSNPETFLAQALAYLNVKVQRLQPEHLPTFTGQHMHGTVFCFHQYKTQLGQHLDCLPSKLRKMFRPPCHDFALQEKPQTVSGPKV